MIFFDNVFTQDLLSRTEVEMPFGLCYAEYIELISLSPSQHFSLKSWKLRGKIVSLLKITLKVKQYGCSYK